MLLDTHINAEERRFETETVNTVYSCIHHWSKGMAVAETTGTSNRMKEQSEKHEKFVRGVFLFSPSKNGK
jgi:hypothetical protein